MAGPSCSSFSTNAAFCLFLYSTPPVLGFLIIFFLPLNINPFLHTKNAINSLKQTPHTHTHTQTMNNKKNHTKQSNCAVRTHTRFITQKQTAAPWESPGYTRPKHLLLLLQLFQDFCLRFVCRWVSEIKSVVLVTSKAHLQFPCDHGEGSGVEVGGGQDLVELSLLLLQRVGQGRQLLLQQQVLEAALLLHLVDGLDELAVQVISLFLGLQTGTVSS